MRSTREVYVYKYMRVEVLIQTRDYSSKWVNFMAVEMHLPSTYSIANLTYGEYND